MSDLVGNPEDRFSHVTAQLKVNNFRHCCHELREDLSSKYADMEITDSGLKISCTLTQRTPNCRSIAKLWASDVQGAVDVFMDKLFEKTVEVKNHVWDGVCEFLDKGNLPCVGWGV